ncbi:Flp family type IVb pilin [Sulfitobacter sp. 1A12157]|uniref:Flp family type IVb pilin n=1 Tax=Sulfitobacter sp. 1A12157 TaxID=3368594 RepID=UPI00374595C9
MMNFIKNFRKDEDGAVTVDWVVLTAAIVGLAIVAFNTIGDNVETMSGNIATDITNFETTADRSN